MLIKVNKQKARKAYNSGKIVSLLPCKVRLGGTVITPVRISNEGGVAFDTMINSYEYHNCNNELGRYTHFYIEDQG